MTAALEGGEWSAARPGRTLPPGKTRYPFYRRLGGPQGRSGRAENLVPAGMIMMIMMMITIIIIIIRRPYNRNTAHVECKSKSETDNSWEYWTHFKITQTVPQKHVGKSTKLAKCIKQPYWALHTYCAGY